MFSRIVRRTYVSTWHSFLRTHELLADNRLKLAAQLSEMSDELNTLAKEADRNRKASKELGARLERGLAEQDALVDKVRASYTAEKRADTDHRNEAGSCSFRRSCRRTREGTSAEARRVDQGSVKFRTRLPRHFSRNGLRCYVDNWDKQANLRKSNEQAEGTQVYGASCEARRRSAKQNGSKFRQL